jgi:ADP-ribosylglycohydrolase
MNTEQQRWRGLILGTAVGDSLGLPAEGISRRRNAKLFQQSWQHGFFLRWGMCSDDTEHTLFVAQALLAYPNNVDLFRKRLAWSLRGWLLALPAGVGLATGRAIIKLWLGFSPKNSGIYSAGNGAAMRVAPIGAFFAHQPELLNQYVAASTFITHRDNRAFIGSKAIAEIIAWVWRENVTEKPSLTAFIKLLQQIDADTEWQCLVNLIAQGLQQNFTVNQFADLMGLNQGITGYVYHTVPMVLYAWYVHFGDFKQTLTSILNCGGDTDTTGAIVGALAGSVTGEQGIPKVWITNILEYPHHVGFLRQLADKLARRESGAVFYFVPAVIFRNLFFFIMVLLHGFRRLLPPY